MAKYCKQCGTLNENPLLPLCREHYFQDKIDNPKKIKKYIINNRSKTNKNIPAKFSQNIKEEILKRDGNMCIICECWQNHDFEFHHAYFGANANRGTNRNCSDQGVTLCSDCHHEIHHGVEGKGKLYRAKCIEYLLKLK